MTPIPFTTPPRNAVRWAVFCFAAGLLLALWLIHSAAFDAPFYFDTIAHLKNKSNLHMAEVSWQSLSDAVGRDFGKDIYRPVSQLSLALTHLQFGLMPRPYRIGNLLIHWAACLAAAFAIHSVLTAPRVQRAHPKLSKAALPVALLAATLWGLHPVHTNVVSYVIQRMASLCGLFTFLCVGSYLRGRANGWSWPWTLGAVVSLALAVGSKENAVTAVASLLLCEWLLLTPLDSRTARGWLWGGWTVALVVPLVALAFNYARIFRYFSYSRRPFTLGERLLTEARIQIDYLLLLVLPDSSRLILTPDTEVSRSLWDPPSTAAALALIAATVAVAVAVGRRKPLLSFCVLWFFAHQLAESTVLPLELYYEHRLYIPSVGLFTLVAAGAWAAGAARRPVVGVGAACLAVLFVGFELHATRQRTRVWADPVTFWTDASSKAPESARVHTNLGIALVDTGKTREAEAVLTKALNLRESKKWIVHLHLADLAYLRGDRSGAKEQLEASLREVRTTNWEAPLKLGLLSVQEGNYTEAQRYLELSLKQKVGNPEAWRLLGFVRMRQGSPAGAEEAIETALRYGPKYAETWNTLGALHFEEGDYGQALEGFSRALALDPASRIYRANIEKARARVSSPSTP